MWYNIQVESTTLYFHCLGFLAHLINITYKVWPINLPTNVNPLDSNFQRHKAYIPVVNSVIVPFYKSYLQINAIFMLIVQYIKSEFQY